MRRYMSLGCSLGRRRLDTCYLYLPRQVVIRFLLDAVVSIANFLSRPFAVTVAIIAFIARCWYRAYQVSYAVCRALRWHELRDPVPPFRLDQAGHRDYESTLKAVPFYRDNT